MIDIAAKVSAFVVRAANRARRAVRHVEGLTGLSLARKRWGKTIVFGTVELTPGRPGTARIELQHEFRSHDTIFEAPPDTRIGLVMMADQVAHVPSGDDPDTWVQASAFGLNSFVREPFGGFTLSAGCHMTVQLYSKQGGKASVSFTGYKPILNPLD